MSETNQARKLNIGVLACIYRC